MQTSITKTVRNKVMHSHFGSVFYPSMFTLYDPKYVSRVFVNLEREHLVTRVSPGIYVKAKYTNFGIVYPPVNTLVEEIAKRDHAKIIPAGATAANRLGLSEQVPMQAEFLTTGSSRELNFGGRKVVLKHGAPRNFEFKSNLMSELVQALRSMGEDNLEPRHEQRIAVLLNTADDKAAIRQDILLLPAWMRKVVKRNIKD